VEESGINTTQTLLAVYAIESAQLLARAASNDKVDTVLVDKLLQNALEQQSHLSS